MRQAPNTHDIGRGQPPDSYFALKRLLDVLLASLALVFLAPLFLIIAAAVKLDSPGPIIYRQKRVRGNQDPGDPHLENNVFDFLKFRSMYSNADSGMHRRFVTQYIQGHVDHVNNGNCATPIYKMKNDPRVTRVGRILRRTSLDELPQFLNILKGDMTLVGPRPALPYEVEQYDGHHRERLVPRAGLTGLWQVSGRTGLTFEEMVELDIEYSRRRSLALDLMILLRTIPVVISARGAW